MLLLTIEPQNPQGRNILVLSFAIWTLLWSRIARISVSLLRINWGVHYRWEVKLDNNNNSALLFSVFLLISLLQDSEGYVRNPVFSGPDGYQVRDHSELLVTITATMMYNLIKCNDRSYATLSKKESWLVFLSQTGRVAYILPPIPFPRCSFACLSFFFKKKKSWNVFISSTYLSVSVTKWFMIENGSSLVDCY